MDDLANHSTSNSTKQRLDILSKLGTVFDKLHAVDHTTIEMKSRRQHLANQVVNRQKELSDLKDKICREIAAKNNFEDHFNIEHSDKLEPPTAATFLNQSSVTEDSELRAANSFFAEAAAGPGILHEKHLYTLLKMIDTILFLVPDGGTSGATSALPKDDKDCQTSNNDWPRDSIISSDSFVQPNSELSAIERKRLSLEQRIRARKSAVQDTDIRNQDQELKSMRYEIEMLQKKLTAAQDEKALADLKVQEQDLNIQEQFEIIQDYSTEIKEYTAKDKQKTKRIQELEAEVSRLLDQRRSENFAFLKLAKTGGKEEKDKPTTTIQEDKNEISSCSSEDVASPEEKDKAKGKRGSSDAANELDCATDLSKLKEDMDWINLQIEKETPCKTMTTERKVDSEKTETPLHTSSEVSTPAPDASPNDLGEKATQKKSKGNFEFPEGGWECSKCQNYNFKGRKECNRCKKPKTTKDLTGKPSHLVKADAEKTPFKLHKDKKTMRLKALKIDTTKAEDKTTSAETALESPFKFNKNGQQLFKESNPKRTHERAGDWICQRCNNHNFSFRTNCNMCHLSHELSEKMLSIYGTQRVSHHKSQKNLMSHQQPGSGGTNIIQNALNDRVVHVHQYFNTYQMPNGGQPGGAPMQMTPTSGPAGQRNMTQSTPTVLPVNSATQQHQTPQKVTNPMTPIGSQQASPSPIFICNKTGQKMPQWRPSNPQTGSTRQLTIDQ